MKTVAATVFVAKQTSAHRQRWPSPMDGPAKIASEGPRLKAPGCRHRSVKRCVSRSKTLRRTPGHRDDRAFADLRALKRHSDPPMVKHDHPVAEIGQFRRLSRM